MAPQPHKPDQSTDSQSKVNLKYVSSYLGRDLLSIFSSELVDVMTLEEKDVLSTGSKAEVQRDKDPMKYTA